MSQQTLVAGDNLRGAFTKCNNNFTELWASIGPGGSQQVINTGAIADDGTGDNLRVACSKTNANFTVLYGAPAPQTINIGTVADDGTGDDLNIAFDKINQNFNGLYGGIGPGPGPGPGGGSGTSLQSALTNASGASALAGSAVYANGASTFGAAIANGSAPAEVIGLVAASAGIANGASGSVTYSGLLSLTAGQWTAVTGGALVPSAVYFLDPVTAGHLTTTATIYGGEYLTYVGQALSTTAMLINIDLPIAMTGSLRPPPGPGVPSVSGVSPSFGPLLGGTTITVTGSNFVVGATAVTVAGVAATAVVVAAGGLSLTCVTPAGSGSPASVVVTTSGGGATGSNMFTYAPGITSISPNTGPASTSVTITGKYFTGATSVLFGVTAATSVVVAGDGLSLTCVTPTGSGIVDISVTTPAGTATGTGLYTYAGAFPSLPGLIGRWNADSANVTLSGSNVVSVADLSLSGNTLTVPAGTVQWSATGSAHGKPAFMFTVANAGHLRSVLITALAGNPASIFVVGQMLTGTENNGGLVEIYNGGNDYDPGGSNIIAAMRNATGNGVTVYQGGATISTPISLATQYRIGVVAGLSSYVQYVNNVPSSAVTSTTAFAAGELILVGARLYSGAIQSFWEGPVSEIILTNTALNTSQLAALDAYFTSKWGT